jgi:hypothetical protein
MEVKGCGFGYALTECERLRKEWKALCCWRSSDPLRCDWLADD